MEAWQMWPGYEPVRGPMTPQQMIERQHARMWTRQVQEEIARAGSRHQPQPMPVYAGSGTSYKSDNTEGAAAIAFFVVLLLLGVAGVVKLLVRLIAWSVREVRTRYASPSPGIEYDTREA